jgi:predicted nucleotidyltransferase
MKPQDDLPESVRNVLDSFVQNTRDVFQNNLRAIVLFGSGAEGRLRPTSDVNLIVLLTSYDPDQVSQIRETYRFAQAAIRLNVMFLLESEIESASQAFPLKFTDILSRRKVLFGTDPFSDLAISHSVIKRNLHQTLLNLLLRLRERYAIFNPNEDQAALAVAEAAGPLRSAAATLLELEGQPRLPPKDALERAAAGLEGRGWGHILENLSKARQRRSLSPQEALATARALIELTERLLRRLEAMED